MDEAHHFPAVRFTREDMLKHVARFTDLKGSDKGMPDAVLPNSYKILSNVLGFRVPDDPSVNSPLGKDLTPAITIAAGFGVSLIRGIPGNGAHLHNHDTNESFMPLTGIWRFVWEVDGDSSEETEYLDLGPYDFISIPPGVPRRFENVSVPEGESTALMLGIVAGDAPKQQYTPRVIAQLRAAEAARSESVA